MPISAFKPEERDMAKAEMPWWKDTKACKVSAYSVFGPSDPKSGALVITPAFGWKVMFDSPTFVIAMTPKGNMVTLEMNADGALTSIGYDAIGADGKKVQVIDQNADGVLDHKMTADGFFVNIDGQWARFEKKDGKPGAVTSGGWRPLVIVDRVWKLAEPR